MYTVLLSILAGVVVGVAWTLLGLWKTWAMGIILGVLVALAAFVLISRVLAKRLEPRFLQAQKQLQSGSHALALATLESLLPFARWQILLEGQIYAQMGILAYAMEDETRALEWLEKSSLRVADARMALAAILYRRREFERAYEVMDTAIRANKKQILPYNAYAFMLEKQGERAKAIEQLQRCLAREPSNESTRDNLLRLQNDRKLNMKRFGMPWYALRLERPPASLRQYPPGTHRGMRAHHRKHRRG